ncbi:MAG: hypothetical protein AAF518_10010 [Spirochaetota bacterium]
MKYCIILLVVLISCSPEKNPTIENTDPLPEKTQNVERNAPQEENEDDLPEAKVEDFKKCEKGFSYDKKFLKSILSHRSEKMKIMEVCDTTIEKLSYSLTSAKDKTNTFYLVNESQIFQQSSNEVTFLKDFDIGYPDGALDLQFKDINGDGNYEVITTGDARGSELIVYTFTTNGFVEIFKREDATKYLLEVKTPHLLIRSMTEGKGKRDDEGYFLEPKKYKLENDKLVLLP